MYFRVNLKMEKPMSCSCFTCVVFIEHNFTDAFLLIRKTWDDEFTVMVGWGGGPINGEDDFEMGEELIPLYGL